MLTPTVSHVPVLVNDLEECTFTRLHLGKGIEVGEGEHSKFGISVFIIYAVPVALSEKAMAPHSSTLAWKIPWTEKLDRLLSDHGVAKSRTRLSDFTFTFHFHASE